MILFVTRKWPPAVGGMETYSLKLSKALEDHAQVAVIALPGHPDGSPPSTAALIGFGIRAAAKILVTRAPRGTVHVADMASWPLALAARLRSRRWRIALSAHGTDVSYSLRGGVKGGFYGAYLRLGSLCLKPATVIANSAATAECARRHGFRRVSVVPLATDMRPASPPGAPENFVLFAGRLIEQKGCAWFIRNVLPALPDGITLKVAGTVWSESEGDALRHPRVDYIGPQRPDTMASLYARALCVVTPNIVLPNGEFEGFGLVATEAAACGGVSLASACGGLREAIIDGVTGFLLPPGAPYAWVQKIVEISGWSRGARARFVARATQEAHVRYSWERVAGQTVEAYNMAGTTRDFAKETR